MPRLTRASGHDYFVTTRPVLLDLRSVLGTDPSSPPRTNLIPIDQDGYQYYQMTPH